MPVRSRLSWGVRPQPKYSRPSLKTALRSSEEGIVTMPDGPDGIVAAEFIRLASGESVMVCRTTVQRGTLTVPVTLLLPQPGERAPSGNDLETMVEQHPVMG